MRRCTQLSPEARHSAHPSVCGSTSSLIWSSCVQGSATDIARVAAGSGGFGFMIQRYHQGGAARPRTRRESGGGAQAVLLAVAGVEVDDGHLDDAVLVDGILLLDHRTGGGQAA